MLLYGKYRSTVQYRSTDGETRDGEREAATLIELGLGSGNLSKQRLSPH